MKKLIPLVMSVALLAPFLASAASNPAITMTPSQIAERIALMQKQANDSVLYAGLVTSITYSSATYAPHSDTQIRDVAKLNGISYDDALLRIKRSEDSQAGKVGKAPIDSTFVHLSYDPAENAWRDVLVRSFYAGFDPVHKTHKFTEKKGWEVLGSYWYCNEGFTFSWDETGSSCK